ncbi:MAG: hypothetical protein PHG73_01240 [Pygmaiobacter sp.]|nr:hypothetical protein [Pygmaiobacter sp.]
MKKLYFVLPNLCIILALCFGTFVVLDWYNPLMNFVANGFSSKLLILFCVCSVLSGIRQIVLELQLQRFRPKSHPQRIIHRSSSTQAPASTNLI